MGFFILTFLSLGILIGMGYNSDFGTFVIIGLLISVPMSFGRVFLKSYIYLSTAAFYENLKTSLKNPEASPADSAVENPETDNSGFTPSSDSDGENLEIDNPNSAVLGNNHDRENPEARQ
jgi:hypothetical protein